MSDDHHALDEFATTPDEPGRRCERSPGRERDTYTPVHRIGSATNPPEPETTPDPVPTETH